MADILRQQEFIGEVVENLRGIAPSGWLEIGATFRAAGTVVGLEVAIETPGGA
ncbi:hypothetical protein IRT45_05060 [Nocardia sp. BSTN01]|uniref:hypothetical protein n=1 Tax=Nocardia sp. BSTN01 TaxID=2783665 RepID=UPI00188E9ACC|nr:hypothetical protein [Nocardia sp. BSTN01]MBF4996523.1 hypothetical protein [Nocardia sp. BSTN01]